MWAAPHGSSLIITVLKGHEFGLRIHAYLSLRVMKGREVFRLQTEAVFHCLDITEG